MAELVFCKNSIVVVLLVNDKNSQILMKMREFREKKVVLYKISAYMRWFSILSVWLCFTIAVNDVSAQTYENYADSVDRYTGERNWHKAEEMLMKALEKEPANPSNFILLSNLGTVHRNMGKLKEALADYDNALSITPNAVAIIHNHAALLLEMDSTKRAYSDYARIKVLDKSDIDSRYYHGMIALGYGYFDIAQADFEEALAIDKNSLDAKRGFAILYKVKNDYEKAASLYSEIIEKENRQSNYMGRAEWYLELGKLQEAESDLQEAQKLNPSDPDIYMLKAKLAELQYRYDDAAGYAEEAVALGADSRLVEQYLKKKSKDK